MKEKIGGIPATCVPSVFSLMERRGDGEREKSWLSGYLPAYLPYVPVDVTYVAM